MQESGRVGRTGRKKTFFIYLSAGVIPLIEIKLPGQLLLLTGAEMGRLLASNPEIWERALKRGKGAIRGRQATSRKPKAVAETENKVSDQVLERCLRD
jgi:hypothetical protein